MRDYPKGAVAVIFISGRNDADPQGYARASDAMVAAAERFPGYLGVESVRGADGVGITVSFWLDDGSARAWKADFEHSSLREQGRTTWYDWYELTVAEITRSYHWAR